MPRTNTAAKKAARQWQAQTGEPYTKALRESSAYERDWLIQLGPTESGSLPYPFVVAKNGDTFGFIDVGTVIGFTTSLADYRISLFWSDVTEPEQIIGLYMVAANPFTGRWSTWNGAVEEVSVAPPRAQRDAWHGGPLDSDQSLTRLNRMILERRAMARQRGDSDDLFQFDCMDGSSLVVASNRRAEDPNTDIALGVVEGFCRGTYGPDEHSSIFLTWEDFLALPKMAVGLVPVIWSSDLTRHQSTMVLKVRAVN